MKKYIFLKHLSGAPHIHCKSVKSQLLELENLLSTYLKINVQYQKVNSKQSS